MITLIYGNKTSFSPPLATTLESNLPFAQFINCFFLICYLFISQKWMWCKKNNKTHKQKCKTILLDVVAKEKQEIIL